MHSSNTFITRLGPYNHVIIIIRAFVRRTMSASELNLRRHVVLVWRLWHDTVMTPQLALRVGTDEVMPAPVVRDLGIYLDCDVSMKSHVMKTVSACFAVLRQLRSVCRSVPGSVLQSLVTSLVLTWLDYGNATLAGIPLYLLKRLQSVMNSAARLVYSSSRYEHITRSSVNCIG